MRRHAHPNQTFVRVVASSGISDDARDSFSGSCSLAYYPLGMPLLPRPSVRLMAKLSLAKLCVVGLVIACTPGDEVPEQQESTESVGASAGVGVSSNDGDGDGDWGEEGTTSGFINFIQNDFPSGCGDECDIWSPGDCPEGEKCTAVSCDIGSSTGDSNVRRAIQGSAQVGDECMSTDGNNNSGNMAPCDFLNVCNAGLLCIDAAGVPEPQCAGASGCCSPLCDTMSPNTMSPSCPGTGQTREPVLDPQPAGFENVGVCSVAP